MIYITRGMRFTYSENGEIAAYYPKDIKEYNRYREWRRIKERDVLQINLIYGQLFRELTVLAEISVCTAGSFCNTETRYTGFSWRRR